jgi:hypothetical protein
MLAVKEFKKMEGGMAVKINMVIFFGILAVAVIGAVAVVGCCCKISDSEPSNTAGVAERTGAALDKAADKTVEATTNIVGKTGDAVKKTAAATKDVAGQAVEKTGEALEKAGAAVEKTGADMQK